MNIIRITCVSSFLTIANLASLPAQAHFLWLAGTPDGRTHLYFGEYPEGLREKSPGRLDEIPGPTVTRAGVALPIKRAAMAFEFAIATQTRDCLLAEERAVPVKDLRKNGIGILKPMFYARSSGDCASTAPGSCLDVQPTMQADCFQVTLAGKPLAKTDVLAHTPVGWTKTVRTDNTGVVNIALPWRGGFMYLRLFISKQHRENSKVRSSKRFVTVRR